MPRKYGAEYAITAYRRPSEAGEERRRRYANSDRCRPRQDGYVMTEGERVKIEALTKAVLSKTRRRLNISERHASVRISVLEALNRTGIGNVPILDVLKIVDEVLTAIQMRKRS